MRSVLIALVFFISPAYGQNGWLQYLSSDRDLAAFSHADLEIDGTDVGGSPDWQYKFDVQQGTGLRTAISAASCSFGPNSALSSTICGNRVSPSGARNQCVWDANCVMSVKTIATPPAFAFARSSPSSGFSAEYGAGETGHYYFTIDLNFTQPPPIRSLNFQQRIAIDGLCDLVAFWDPLTDRWKINGWRRSLGDMGNYSLPGHPAGENFSWTTNESFFLLAGTKFTVTMSQNDFQSDWWTRGAQHDTPPPPDIDTNLHVGSVVKFWFFTP